jgi:hypothetical protein
MARPKDVPLPAKHADNISKGMRARWARLREFEPIREAADAGDISRATELLLEYIASRQSPAELSRPLTRHEQEIAAAAKAQADAYDEAAQRNSVNRRGPEWERLARENRVRLRGRDRALGRPRSVPRRGTA